MPCAYAALSMANPLAPSQTCSNLAPEYSQSTEQGLEWDIISQVGTVLKSNQSPGPLAGLAVQQVYASGYSRGANDLVTYANASAPSRAWPMAGPSSTAICSAPRSVGRPRSANVPTWYPPGDPHSVIQPNRVPILRVNTQSDFGWWFGAPGSGISAGSTLNRRADHDGVGDQFRLYEIPGASHLVAVSGALLPELGELGRIGSGVVAYSCAEQPGSDFPLQYFLRGAFVNLDRWARTGAPPVRGDRIALSNPGSYGERTLLDQWGKRSGRRAVTVPGRPAGRLRALQFGRWLWCVGPQEPVLFVVPGRHVPGLELRDPGPQCCAQAGKPMAGSPPPTPRRSSAPPNTLLENGRATRRCKRRPPVIARARAEQSFPL